MTITDSAYEQCMWEGRAALQMLRFDAALDRFRHAESEARGNDELAEARENQVEALRQLGRLHEATDVGLRATETRAQNPSAWRGLGEVYHELALVEPTLAIRDEYRRQAEEAFAKSEGLTAAGVGESGATASFQALLRYHWAPQNHRPALRRRLRSSVAVVRFVGDTAYETDALIRLMRCVNLPVRLWYAPRALKLTPKGSVNRKQVWRALLFGDRVFVEQIRNRVDQARTIYGGGA